MKNKFSNIAFYLICALLVFAPLARGGVHGWAVTVIHMITVAAVAFLFIQKSRDWDWSWISTPLDLPILLLLVLACVSTLNSSLKPASFKAVILLFNYVLVYYLVIHTVRTSRELYGLTWLIIGLGAFLAIFGFIKFAGINLFPWFHYPDLPDFGALTSTYGNPNHIAGFFEMAIPLVMGLLLADNRNKQNIKYYVPLTLLFGAALLLTMSRGGWTCGMLGFVFLAGTLLFKQDFPRRRTVIALAGSGIVLVLVMLSSYPAVQELLTVREVVDQAGGIDGRLQITKAVGVMIMDRPLLGFGPGTFAYSFFLYQPAGIQGWYNMAHNDYVHFTAELGLFLPVIITWMLIVLFRQGFKKLGSRSLLTRGIALGSMAGIFSILCHSIIDFNLHIPANALIFTVLCALVAAPEIMEVKGKRSF